MAKPELFPKTVDICGVVFEVRFSSDLDDRWGDFDIDKGLIRLSNDCFKEDGLCPWRCLKHEMVHAWMELTGLNRMVVPENEKEEGMVRSIEYLLEPALRSIWEAEQEEPDVD